MDSQEFVSRRSSQAHGDYLGDRFWLEKPRSHVTRSLKRGVLAVTQIRSDLPTPEPSQSIPYDEAYLAGLMIWDSPDNQLWQDGHAARAHTMPSGSTALFDLRRDPINFTRTAHHSLHFYLPRVALMEIAEQGGVRFDGELCYDFAVGYDDPVIRDLGAALLPSLERNDPLDGLVLDHILYAAATHMVQRYGNIGSAKIAAGGTLTRWQERRAKELMAANLGSNISLKMLADECGLSVTHFARAFRRATERSPHHWLQERRIEKAAKMLSNRNIALADVAIACGFADQSHFTKVFTKHMGVAPGQWRRQQPPPPSTITAGGPGKKQGSRS